jgi:ribosome-binding protein aMBF1 (putative translation factor)
MSGRTKTPLTKRNESKLWVITGPKVGTHAFPSAEAAVRFLQGATKSAGRSSSAKERDSVPWREAMKDRIAQGGEAAAVLRGARATKGLTQMELAAKLGIPQGNVSAMENGKRPIGREMAKRLGEILDVDYRVFL